MDPVAQPESEPASAAASAAAPPSRVGAASSILASRPGAPVFASLAAASCIEAASVATGGSVPLPAEVQPAIPEEHTQTAPTVHHRLCHAARANAFIAART